MSKEQKYYTITTLKRERGWTDGLVKKLLRDPDVIADNPYYRNGNPMRLYLKERVHDAENEDCYQRAQEGRKKRHNAAMKGVQTKKDRLMRMIEEMDISVQVIDIGDVIEQAVHSYNDRGWERGEKCEKIPAEGLCDSLFHQRVCVNFLRHECTDYDWNLEATAKKVGRGDGIAEIRRKIYDEIRKKYPLFRAECRRQMRKRNDTNKNDLSISDLKM